MARLPAAVLALALALPRVAAAVEPLAYDVRVDLPVIGVTGAAWIASETFFKAKLAPETCRWCDRDTSGGDTLNAFDAAGRSLRWNSPKTADTVSNIGGFALLPILMLGMDALAARNDGAIEAWPVDAMIVVETVAIQAAVNQLVKFAAGRERPFVHVLPETDKRAVHGAEDNNLSFYSGHSSLVFSLAVSSGTVAQMRGYRWAPAIWAVGLPLAATVAYLRMAADKHYAADVLVGSAVGAAMGFAIPYLFHNRRQGGPIGISAGAQGLTVVLPLP